MSDDKEEKQLDQVVNGFFEKTKNLWLAVLAILVVAAIVVSIVFFTKSSKVKKGNLFLDDSVYQFMTIKSTGTDEEKADAEIKFIDSIVNFADKNGKNSISSRAYMMLAQIYFDKEDWKSSLDYWLKASVCGKSYLTGISWYNAGVCYEQLGDVVKAEDAYQNAVGKKDFALTSHALFSLARVLETQGKLDEAIVQYKKLSEDYTDSWSNYAKSRLIVLEEQKENK